MTEMVLGQIEIIPIWFGEDLWWYMNMQLILEGKEKRKMKEGNYHYLSNLSLVV